MHPINICSPSFDEADSYGIIGAQLVKHLSALGLHVNPFALAEKDSVVQGEELRALLAKPIRACLGSVALGYPTNTGKFPALTQMGPKIALTMFESSKIPPDWAPILNTYDAVIVPSTFCWDVFKQCGVTSPIHVVPLGVNDVYRTIQRPTEGPFTFLAFLDRGKRKGGLVALQAFLRAFGDDSNYRLILKSRKVKVAMEILNENVELIQQDLTEEELHQLYGRAHCMIFPSMGEGWGLPPREFVATGGIALATNWGGTADDIWDWGIPLPYRLVKADWLGVQKFAGLDLGEWAEPDIDALAQKLRWVAEFRQELGYWWLTCGALNVQRLYSWRNFAEETLKIWKGVTDGNSGAKRSFA